MCSRNSLNIYYESMFVLYFTTDVYLFPVSWPRFNQQSKVFNGITFIAV